MAEAGASDLLDEVREVEGEPFSDGVDGHHIRAIPIPEGDENHVVRPCVETYVGPVLTLTEATFNGDQVQQVEILRVLGGDGVDLADELDSPDSTGLKAGPAGEIVCTLPCGFGEWPGRWRVKVAGPDGSEVSVMLAVA